MPVNGIVLPLPLFILMHRKQADAGKYVEGAVLKGGQPILELASDLELSTAIPETQVFNVLTQMRIARNNVSGTVNPLEQMAEVDNALKGERVYRLNKNYWIRKLWCRNFSNLKTPTIYQVRREKTDRDVGSSLTNKIQLEQNEQSYVNMRKALWS